jgi:methyl coenzyme M reductase gamma subunit
METIDLSLDRPVLIKDLYLEKDRRYNIKKGIVNEIIPIFENNQKNPLALQLPENCPLDNYDIFDYPQIYRSNKVSSKEESNTIDKLQEIIKNNSNDKINLGNKRCCNIM